MKHIFLFFLLAVSVATFAQETTAKLYVIRQSVSGGTMGGFTVFQDDALICGNLNNNRHIIIDVAPGKHSYTAQFDGRTIKKKAKKEAIEIEMEAGKSYYITLNYQVKGLIGNLYVQEITENSAKKILSDSKIDDDCK